jgi:hypothetical protein
MQILPLHRPVSSGARDHSPSGEDALSEERIREEAFNLFKTGTVRRLSSTHYVVKAQNAIGWNLVELKDGVWMCDCNSDRSPCSHVYSTQLHRYALRQVEENPDESHLKCRYCGSIDIAGCGFRYGARGISRRYFCRDCERKFSVPYVQASIDNKPNELAWLLNETGMLITRLTEVLVQLNARLTSTLAFSVPTEPKARNGETALNSTGQIAKTHPQAKENAIDSCNSQ